MKGLMGRVHLKCETPGGSWSISCNKVRFLASRDMSIVVVYDFLLLVFVVLTNVVLHSRN